MFLFLKKLLVKQLMYGLLKTASDKSMLTTFKSPSDNKKRSNWKFVIWQFCMLLGFAIGIYIFFLGWGCNPFKLFSLWCIFYVYFFNFFFERFCLESILIIYTLWKSSGSKFFQYSCILLSDSRRFYFLYWISNSFNSILKFFRSNLLNHRYIFTYLYDNTIGVCMYAYICIYSHTYVYIYTCTHTHTHIYIYIYIYIYLHMHTHMYVCMYVYVYLYMHIYMCVYIYMCVCVCVCVFVSIYSNLCMCQFGLIMFYDTCLVGCLMSNPVYRHTTLYIRFAR